jgi:hypothetical protein
MTTAREKAIKLLVAKFVKLVDSLDPGERLSIRKVRAKKSVRAGKKRDIAGKQANTKTKKTKKAEARAQK